MKGPELDRLLVDSKLEQLTVTASVEHSAAAVEQLAAIVEGLKRPSARSKAKRAGPKGSRQIDGTGWLLPESRSDFYVLYALSHTPKSKEAGASRIGVVIRFFRKPDSDPPKDLVTDLKAGRTVEWLLEQMSLLVERGRKVSIELSSAVEMPRFRPALLQRTAEVVHGSQRFRCSGVEFVATQDVADGLMSFQVSEEDGFDGQPATVVFLRYRRLVETFVGLNAEEEQAASFKLIRETLNEEG